MARLKFKRQNSGIKRLKEVWRRPKGRHSKMRQKIKGHGIMPSIGYKKNESRRALHPSGKIEFLISSTSELENLCRANKDKTSFAIRISSRVGKKKRLEIIKKAESFGLKILNPNFSQKILTKKLEKIEEVKT